jgi:hypothetical protein
VGTADDLAALDVATAVQRTNEIDWRQPPRLMPPQPPGTQQGLGDSQAKAGPSGGGATKEPEYMDVEEFFGGGCGLNERDSSLSDSDSEMEGDEKMPRSEATKMPVSLEEGGLYRHLHHSL